MKRKQHKERTSQARLSSTERALFRGTDNSDDPIVVRGDAIHASGERWIDAFLEANKSLLNRLALTPEVRTYPRLELRLRTASKIGAVPLFNPQTRKVAAGLLVEPRFRWVSLGAVYEAIGYSVMPSLGGSPLVPASAREVPPWLIAGPVIRRIAELVKKMRRGFVDCREIRSSPRGRVDWTSYVRRNVPTGRWGQFICSYTEPGGDPDLIAHVRWTIGRLREELSVHPWSLPSRTLMARAEELLLAIGDGPRKRPPAEWFVPGSPEHVRAALEAMSWVADERGLGGLSSLDGLAWDITMDDVWEAWVAAFSSDLSRSLGLSSSGYAFSGHSLRWEGPARSMSALRPDIMLRGEDRTVFLDAKYKAHFHELVGKGFNGAKAETKEAHRADLHQALAYSALSDAPAVDSILVYPELSPEAAPSFSKAVVTMGRRHSRVILATLPFGFRSPTHKDECIAAYRAALAENPA